MIEFFKVLLLKYISIICIILRSEVNLLDSVELPELVFEVILLVVGTGAWVYPEFVWISLTVAYLNI